MTKVVEFCHKFSSLKNSAGEEGRGREEFYISPTHAGLYGPNPFSHCHPPFCGPSLGSFSVQIGLYTGDSRESIQWAIHVDNATGDLTYLHVNAFSAGNLSLDDKSNRMAQCWV